MNNTNKVSRFIKILAIPIGLALVIMGFIKSDVSKSHVQKKELKYDGTYSLYVGKEDHYNIRWITSTKNMGAYEVLNDKNKIIASGETDSSRTHKIDLNSNIKAPFTLKFGAKNQAMHEVKIKAGFTLEETEYQKVDSIYVVGDVHGRYDQMINLLKNSNIIDENLLWTAGKAQIVFLGDIFDRGDDVTKVLWFIHDLEDKAEKVGGKVHLVLGNHEIMTMTKDLRYLSRKEQNIAIGHGLKYDELFHPTASYLGSWLRSKVSLLKINQVVFAHGGILDISPNSLEEFNNQAYYYMKDPMYLDMDEDYPDSIKYNPTEWWNMKWFFYDGNGPYWYRGYVYSDTLKPQLSAMLRRHNSKIHVVAHTPLETITERYDGKLLTTDLNDAATQLLLLIRNRNKYTKYKINSQGVQSNL
jgi:hypothetical protein